jgi:hypothetical protein
MPNPNNSTLVPSRRTFLGWAAVLPLARAALAGADRPSWGILEARARARESALFA